MMAELGADHRKNSVERLVAISGENAVEPMQGPTHRPPDVAGLAHGFLLGDGDVAGIGLMAHLAQHLDALLPGLGSEALIDEV